MKPKQRIEEAARKRSETYGTLDTYWMTAMIEGAHFGFKLAIEMLRSEEASEKYSNDECITTPKEWADWLEGKMKE